MTPLTNFRLFSIIPILAFGLLMGGCNTDDKDPDDPDNGKHWEIVGLDQLGSHATAGSIYANNGNVYMGYFDSQQNLPMVKQFNAVTNSWQDKGAGLLALYNSVMTDEFVNTSFAFRQDGATSYVFFNKSITDSELIIFKCEGEMWEQMPSVPLDQLYGGYWGMIQSGMEVEVKNGNVYVVIRWDVDPETYLCVFTYSGGAWSLNPDRVSYANIPGEFYYEGYFDEPRIRVSDNGTIYLGYYGWDRTTDVSSARVSKNTGAGWTDMIVPNTIPVISASDRMNFFVHSAGSQDQILIAPYQTDNHFHAHLFSGSSWSEPVTTDISNSFTFTDCSDCFAMMTSVTGVGTIVKLYENGTWKDLGGNDIGLTGSITTSGSHDDITYDASIHTLYVAYSGTDYNVTVKKYVLD